MKRASQRAWDLVQSLHSGPNLWYRLFGWVEPPLQAIEEIAASGEAEVIPYLLGFALSPDANVQRAATDAIGRLFVSVESTDYVQLDYLSRSALNHESKANLRWRNLKQSEVTFLAGMPHGGLLVRLATFHSYGYVRAAAVQELSSATDGSEIPFLLLRLNDWVEEVRNEALRVITPRANIDCARHFLRNLRLVYRLRQCRRDAHVQIIQTIEGVLKSPDALPLLKDGIASTDRWLRRTCFRLAVESQTPGSSSLLKDLLSHSDPVLRVWATRSMPRELADHDLRLLVQKLRRDPFMPVRCEALTILVDRLPDCANGELHDALWDVSASVRAVARYYLQQRGFEDFRTVYVNALQATTPRTLFVAIAGLGETGKPNDATLLRPFLTSPSISLRKATLCSIAALDGEQFLDDLLLALTDAHIGVSKTARLALEPRSSLLDGDMLWKVFANERRFHVRKNVLLLLSRLPTWTRLPFIVQACSDSDPDIATIASQCLEHWRKSSNRSSPTNGNLKMMQGLLTEYESCLDQNFVQEMRFWAKQ